MAQLTTSSNIDPAIGGGRLRLTLLTARSAMAASSLRGLGDPFNWFYAREGISTVPALRLLARRRTRQPISAYRSTHA